MTTEKDRTFLHSGDMGDVIASLAAMKDLGGGKLYLDVSGGAGEYRDLIYGTSFNKGLRFNKTSFDFIKPLIEAQPYVTGVEVYDTESPVEIDYDLNKFRKILSSKDTYQLAKGNLLYANCVAWNMDFNVDGTQWLSNVEPTVLERKVVVARSARYQGGHMFLRMNAPLFEKHGVFVGTDIEYQTFKDATEVDMPHYKCNTALDLASVILGAETVVVNSTFAFWVAMGQKHKNILHELCPSLPSTVFQNLPNITNFMGSNVYGKQAT